MNNTATLKSMLYRFLDALNDEGLAPSAIISTVALYIEDRGESDSVVNSLEEAAAYIQRDESAPVQEEC